MMMFATCYVHPSLLNPMLLQIPDLSPPVIELPDQTGVTNKRLGGRQHSGIIPGERKITAGNTNQQDIRSTAGPVKHTAMHSS